MREWDGLFSDEDLEVARLSGYGATGGLGVRPVVLVIDVTTSFCGDRPEPITQSILRWRNSCGEGAWLAADQIAGLLSACRRTNVPVIYTKGGLGGTASRVYAGRWSDKNDRHDRTAATAGAYEILPLIAPRPTDLVVTKSKPSAFFGTPLLSCLVYLQADTIIACGATTSGCVRASVVDAFSYNYRVAVVTECTFDRTMLSHQVNLFDMNQKYADVMSRAQVEAYLETISPGAFRPQWPA